MKFLYATALTSCILHGAHRDYYIQPHSNLPDGSTQHYHRISKKAFDRRSALQMMHHAAYAHHQVPAYPYPPQLPNYPQPPQAPYQHIPIHQMQPAVSQPAKATPPSIINAHHSPVAPSEKSSLHPYTEVLESETNSNKSMRTSYLNQSNHNNSPAELSALNDLPKLAPGELATIEKQRRVTALQKAVSSGNIENIEHALRDLEPVKERFIVEFALGAAAVAALADYFNKSQMKQVSDMYEDCKKMKQALIEQQKLIKQLQNNTQQILTGEQENAQRLNKIQQGVNELNAHTQVMIDGKLVPVMSLEEFAGLKTQKPASRSIPSHELSHKKSQKQLSAFQRLNLSKLLKPLLLGNLIYNSTKNFTKR